MDLYNDVILELNNAPLNYRLREDAKYLVNAHNTYCGDKFSIQLDYNTVSSDIAFSGFGCAVSKAAASVLTDLLDGKTWEEMLNVCNSAVAYLKGEADLGNLDRRIEAFVLVKKYPGRYACASLCWEEMGKFCIEKMKK